MGNIAPSKSYIQEQEIRYRSAVSESTFFKMGASLNFMNERVYQEKHFLLNGRYNMFGTINGFDGLTVFPYDVEIFAVAMHVLQAGSGTTTVDLKMATGPNSSWTSIFSTLPSISSGAGNYAFVKTGDSLPNMTAPVINTTLISAGSAIRADLVGYQSGDTRSLGVILFYRPR